VSFGDKVEDGDDDDDDDGIVAPCLASALAGMVSWGGAGMCNANWRNSSGGCV